MARTATQITRVLWTNAAWLELARARPSKKSTNARLPPIAATAVRLSTWIGRRRTLSCPRSAPTRPRAPPRARRAAAATRFLAVV